MTDHAPSSRPEPPPPLLRLLVEALLRDVDALEARIVDAAIGLEPSYRKGGPAREDLALSVRTNILRLLQAFLADEVDDEELYDAPRETGRRRAAQGFPLEAVLRAYRLGVELIWEALLAQARAAGPEATELVVDQVSRLWFVMDTFSLVMAEAYRHEEDQLRRYDLTQQERLLDDLLEGRGADPAVAADTHRLMGLPPVARYVVVVAPAERHRPGRGTPRELLAARAVTSFWGYRGGREFGLIRLGTTPPVRLCQLLGEALAARQVGVSPEVGSLAEIGHACRQADLALSTLPEAEPGVVRLDDRLPEALLVSSPDISARLVRRAFGRVLELPPTERDALLETVGAWFDNNQSTVATARSLFCHRNTVLNRLARFQQVSGESLEDERQRLVCQLALASWMGGMHKTV